MTSTFVLNVVIASTRPGRVGLPVGTWFSQYAQNHGKFSVKVTDLAELNLPFFDEPNHPMAQKYTKEHTKTWAKIVSESDAFVFVIPEYNFSAPATLVNALDYLYLEWNYKPAGFVSYGGMSGGIRAVQDLKTMLTTFKMVPLVEAVALPMVFPQVKDGVFTPADAAVGLAADKMLDELVKWTTALKTIRS
ncbi:mitochondrial NADPH-dependent FMN reductase domain-containing protein [Andalucia godoyi]|uniref:Mitochondrial NADPH-dependent FMN reductase domain-containing protein n=1 Tax=Andalucia godoyi TaxID=505711 RepID=A0A8K0AK00_ANDGO|nr:mitochondrial NADPH-dependent FMN reductase domain-containing protein [Andalucia godoyi]|eukprot:ANDGO_05666.mRNA.1 mitochondrial NADPH-dependent FMN reductase domain-containing protein